MGDTAEEPSTRRSGRSETGRGTAGHEESGRGEMRARPHSLTAQVVEFIEDLCVDPDVTPGDQLPPEGELATRFGVSRVVLREAMKTLEARGLVQRRQGKPAVVASPNAIPVEKFVALAVLRDKHAVMEFTEIRKALEVHGARLAARRIAGPEEPETRPHLTRAREAIAEQRANPLDMPTRLRTDVAFHQALVAAAGNISLTQILDALEQSLGESREQSHHRYLAAGGDPAGSATEHEELLDAVVTGDPAQAVAAMEHHLQVTLHEIETRPETGEEGAGTTDDR